MTSFLLLIAINKIIVNVNIKMPPAKKKKGSRFGRDEPNKNLIHYHTNWYKNEQRRIQQEREQEQIESSRFWLTNILK